MPGQQVRELLGVVEVEEYGRGMEPRDKAMGERTVF